jgi:hypothetical protein
MILKENEKRAYNDCLFFDISSSLQNIFEREI